MERPVGHLGEEPGFATTVVWVGLGDVQFTPVLFGSVDLSVDGGACFYSNSLSTVPVVQGTRFSLGNTGFESTYCGSDYTTLGV